MVDPNERQGKVLVINKENKRELLDMPMLEIMHLQQYRVILALFSIFIPYG